MSVSSATQEDKGMAYLDPRLFDDQYRHIFDPMGGEYPCKCSICKHLYLDRSKKPSQVLATLKRFFLFFFLQFASYSLICWNYRAVARGWVWHVVISDLMFAALNFTLIKKVAEAKGKVAMWGYVLGGAVGSAASVLLTKYLWGS